MDNAKTLAERLCEAIQQVLLHHRLSYTEGEDAEAFPLVDMLCPPGSRDIAKGRDEITLICDAIYNDAKVNDLIERQAAELAALRSLREAVRITRACLLDSVEAHGTHGGWLHEEARRLMDAEAAVDALREPRHHRRD